MLIKMKVAVCCIIKLENLYIEEFILHYKSIGIDHIFIYDNNDINDEDPNNICKKYIKNGLVSIINYRDQQKYPMGQGLISAFNDCWINNRNNYDWILFCDNDEFLNFNDKYENNIKKYLADECFNNVDIIKINWKCYDDNNLIYYENKPLKERFTHLCWDNPYSFDENTHIKSLCNCHSTKKFIWDSNSAAHSPNTFLDNTLIISDNSGKIIKKYVDYIYNQQINYINYDKAWLDHYRLKTIDEYINNKIKKLTNKGYTSLGFTSNMFFIYNNYLEEKEKIYLRYINKYSKNCIYTIIINDEKLIELKNKLKNWDYICFTNNKNLISNTWNIIYINTKNIYQFYIEYLLMPNRYLKNYDFSFFINNKIIRDLDFSNIKKTYIDVLYSYNKLIYTNQFINDEIQIIGRYHKDQQLVYKLVKLNNYFNKLFKNQILINFENINKIICNYIKENINYKIINFPIILTPNQKFNIYKKNYNKSWHLNLNIENEHKLINWAEKIMYLNIKYNYLDTKTQYCDKIKIKELIKKFNLSELNIIPIIGIYNNAFDIYDDLEKLPNNFIIKCNHDSGSYKIIDENQKLNDDICIELNHKLNKIYGIEHGETQYLNIDKKIIVEPLIKGNFKDYCFFCFKGRPIYCLIKYDHKRIDTNINRLNNTIDKINLYDMNFLPLDKYINNSYKKLINNNFNNYNNIQIPSNFYIMVYICSIISKEFEFVRIDLMNDNNNIYFLELTFSPMGLNNYHYFNKEFNDELGKYININYEI